jgi:uncharacterized protein YbgA (DUF1722 family)/uncharacterized protein YbbK (DUF523 family)
VSATPKEAADERLRVGISACLLGEQVRFDGGHKRDGFAVDVLGAYVDYVAVCPEVELGLGVPRPTLRLEGSAARPRLVEPASRVEHTVAMEAYAARKVAELRGADLDGYVLKRASPSCGMERVKLYPHVGAAPLKQGVGLFAAALLAAMPELPVEEEGRLFDPRLRDNFVERLFAYRRVRRLFAGRWDTGTLVRFHTAEKMLLLAHDEPAYRGLGRLVAGAAGLGKDEVARRYRARYMAALAVLATPKKHTNVLQHMAGHLKELLDAADRAELADSIDEYRRGLVPLIVPITLLRHHVRKHRVTYLLGQRYLEPHPRELMLRNRV